MHLAGGRAPAGVPHQRHCAPRGNRQGDWASEAVRKVTAEMITAVVAATSTAAASVG